MRMGFASRSADRWHRAGSRRLHRQSTVLVPYLLDAIRFPKTGSYVQAIHNGITLGAVSDGPVPLGSGSLHHLLHCHIIFDEFRSSALRLLTAQADGAAGSLQKSGKASTTRHSRTAVSRLGAGIWSALRSA